MPTAWVESRLVLFKSPRHRIERATLCADKSPVILHILDRDSATPGARQRFARSYELLSSLSEPGLAKALELREEDGEPCLVLSDPGGLPLCSSPLRGSIGIADFLKAAIGLMTSIEKIHASGNLLGSISRAGLFIGAEGRGLSLIDLEDTIPISQEGRRWLDLEFAEEAISTFSPERTGRMNRPLDSRGDYYSAGAILYELVCGRGPFLAADILGYPALPPRRPHRAAPESQARAARTASRTSSPSSSRNPPRRDTRARRGR